jgi:UDP-3-O-[3-hydroxymyristoyl] N-acetylglucosamine deacetylase
MRKGMSMQTTFRADIALTGIGLHTGRPARLKLRPAPEGHGIVFVRKDVTGRDQRVPARWDIVDQTPLCTRLVNSDGVSVSTVEHLMAALAGCGVLNALVELDGPEVPILDGSSAPFVRAILATGLVRQSAPIRAVRIVAPVTARNGRGWARLSPSDGGLSMRFHIDFEDTAIGRQDLDLDLGNGTFVRELCDSRTFCSRAEVAAMQAGGLALGGVPGVNAVVFDEGRIEGGARLRHTDEPVRHKMLDALGDLALAGGPILGRYEGHKAGHALTNALLRTLFDTPDAWEWVVCDADTASRLPGVGVRPSSIPEVA